MDLNQFGDSGVYVCQYSLLHHGEPNGGPEWSSRSCGEYIATSRSTCRVKENYCHIYPCSTGELMPFLFKYLSCHACSRGEPTDVDDALACAHLVQMPMMMII